MVITEIPSVVLGLNAQYIYLINPLPNGHICRISANICSISVTVLQLSAVGFPISVKYL